MKKESKNSFETPSGEDMSEEIEVIRHQAKRMAYIESGAASALCGLSGVPLFFGVLLFPMNRESWPLFVIIIASRICVIISVTHCHSRT